MIIFFMKTLSCKLEINFHVNNNYFENTREIRIISKIISGVFSETLTFIAIMTFMSNPHDECVFYHTKGMKIFLESDFHVKRT